MDFRVSLVVTRGYLGVLDWLVAREVTCGLLDFFGWSLGFACWFLEYS